MAKKEKEAGKAFSIDTLMKSLDDSTHIAAEGLNSSEFSGYVDTGSLALNALCCGDLFGGFPDNKVFAFGGESATGKTFFVLGIMKNFLDKNPNGYVLYVDTEAAVTTSMLLDRGINPSRVIISEPETVQQFRTNVLKFVGAYLEAPKEKRMPFMVVLDSLGNLSTTKELADAEAGEEKKDMTRAQQIRATFRTIRLKLAKAKVPMLVTNHTYAAIGTNVPTQEMGGGGGLKYSSDYIAILSKAQDKVEDEIVGSLIRVRMWKSRLTREKKVVRVKINHRTGLDRYYGLLEIGERTKFLEKVKVGNGEKYKFPDGQVAFEKAILRDPEKYWTHDTLIAFNEVCKRDFCYGGDELPPSEDEDVEEAA